LPTFDLWELWGVYTLPSGILNQIIGAQSGISERARLESNMDYYAYTINMLNADLFRAGIEELKLDSVISVLKEDDNKVNRENLFSAFLAAGDAGGADSVLTVIKNIVAEPATYEISMQTINLKMLKDTITATELDNTTLASIDLFSSNNPEQAFKAKSLLKAARGQKNKREPYSESEVNNRSMETPEHIPTILSDVDFTVYPNPASDIINIQASDEGCFEISLYNQLGLIVTSIKFEGLKCTIDLKGTPTGVYQLLVFRNGSLIDVSKISIIK